VNTPLGTYGPLAAAIIAAAVVLGFIAAVLFRTTLGLADVDVNSLKELALIALGAVFGSTVGAVVSTNGLKREVAALHHRADVGGLPPANGGGPS
jgi:hypothetical protein